MRFATATLASCEPQKLILRVGDPQPQNRLWLTSEPIFYLLANKKERFVPSPLCQKERNLNRTVFDLGFFWRRGRDSNPRGFWPNGFQDRLVMTASIPLQIYTSILYAYICRDCIETARKFICESAAYANQNYLGARSQGILIRHFTK